MFFAMFDWYSHENVDGDPPDEAKYSTWAIISVVDSAFVISAEILIYVTTSVPIVVYSAIELPEYLRFAWSTPFFLVLNYFLYLRDNRGYKVVREFRRENPSTKRTWKLIGGACSIVILLSSFALVALGPLWPTDS